MLVALYAASPTSRPRRRDTLVRIAMTRLGLLAVAAASLSVSPPGTAADAPAAPPAPRAGCATFADDKEDGKLGQLLPNDPDLDIVNVVLASPPGLLRAYVQVTELGVPEYAAGHQFTASFLLDGKPVVIFAGQDSPAALDDVHGAANTAGAGSVLNGVSFNGVRIADAKLEVVWDEKTNTVVMTTDRASIEAASKLSLADGTLVKEAAAKSFGDYVYATLGADTATGKTPETSTYTIGDNTCFAPPEGKLSLQVPTSIVSGHTAVVSGVLSTATGTAVAGKQVSLALAGKTVTVTSAADGKFSASFAITSNAGSYPVTATWAGDDTLQKVTATAPLLVKIQPTSTSLASAVSGTAVVVKATLLDDIRKPIGGQTITWYVDGKAVGTSRTDSAGRASWRTVKGKLVKASYAGIRNRYAASSASRRT